MANKKSSAWISPEGGVLVVPIQHKKVCEQQATTLATNVRHIQNFISHYLLNQYPEHKNRLKAILDGEGKILLWVAYDVLRDTEKALDCAKDALESACKSLRRRSPQEVEKMDLLNWLKTIIKNTAIDILKKDAELRLVSLQRLIEDMQSEDPIWYELVTDYREDHQPEASLLHQDACTRLANMIAQLPQRQAYAILAHFLNEQHYRTIAANYFSSEKAANMAVSRGIKTLKQMVNQRQLKDSDFSTDQFRGMLTETLEILAKALQDKLCKGTVLSPTKTAVAV